MRAALALALATVFAGGGSAQTASWHHLQVSGIATASFSVRLTIGAIVYELPGVPAHTNASELARDLAREINSARHGHQLFAACNGLDGSIVSIVADGSPTPSTTPWLGRLIPRPRVDVVPGDCGISIERTDIENTLAAVRVEGETAPAAEATLTTRINGRPLTLTLAGTISEEAASVGGRLADLINRDPGFRSSILQDDTGQLIIFVTGENLGGGIRIDDPPRGVDGLRFSNSSTLFASDTLRVGQAPRRN